MFRFLFFYTLSVITFCDFSCIGQQSFSGRIIESNSNDKGIPNVTISVVKKNYYSITNENGFFKFDCNKCTDSDSIRFSSVGFEQASFSIQSLPKNAMIKLKESNTILSEVKVSSKNNFFIDIGNIDKKSSSSLGSGFMNFGEELALQLPSLNIQEAYITKVRFFFRKIPTEKNGYKEPFKLNLYAVNENNGMPCISLLPEDILIRAEKSNKWFEIDISKYQISYPPNGIFISMKILDEDEYAYKAYLESVYSVVEKKRITKKRYLIPHLCNSVNIYKNLKNWKFSKVSKNWQKIDNSFGTFMMGLKLNVFE
ncbi:carboxypeptidase-like regulatory domain-containing protein [Arcicella sp. BE140]|uniref:carboxypeptidase-like regulatory domain-containing protein n=2 Tax=Arcicella TaxID=217140 RepID=UPI002857D2A2|nr:carboxypeptidase-like regulatory domain-containing protein [Arcicella sp. BE140]MDR6563437.1 hypothetical protein [Arcicella sp. BE51]MDR6824764.1 hypothetical protein [Arcicella sp. BE139]